MRVRLLSAAERACQRGTAPLPTSTSMSTQPELSSTCVLRGVLRPHPRSPHYPAARTRRRHPHGHAAEHRRTRRRCRPAACRARSTSFCVARWSNVPRRATSVSPFDRRTTPALLGSRAVQRPQHNTPSARAQVRLCRLPRGRARRVAAHRPGRARRSHLEGEREHVPDAGASVSLEAWESLVAAHEAWEQVELLNDMKIVPTAASNHAEDQVLGIPLQN